MTHESSTRPSKRNNQPLVLLLVLVLLLLLLLNPLGRNHGHYY
jgi:hypothetical protein